MTGWVLTFGRSPFPVPGVPAKTRQVEAHGIMKFDAGESMEPLGARDEFDT